MNSFWNKNAELFSRRFPILAAQSRIDSVFADFEAKSEIYEIIPSKTGILTAKENGILLHSIYNPLKEAEKNVKSARTENIFSAAFFSVGLGYSVLRYAELFPTDTIIIIEPKIEYLFESFKFTDFTKLFEHKNLIIAANAETQQVIQLIEQNGGFSHCAIIENPAQSKHAESYFAALKKLIARNIQKEKINDATRKKFCDLWLKNGCKNLKTFFKSDGINIYKNKFSPEIPAVILAAGSTLKDSLEYLSEIKKHAILIAVDTALANCVRSEVQPDFIILTDPQYYAFRHIAEFSADESVFVTESAVYPQALRFRCKKIVFCSSLFPLGQFFESRAEKKGKLGSGGSVATAAWDFARFIGAKKIFFSGLDLGFPNSQTHIKGSSAEEKTHTISSRLQPAETFGVANLLSVGTRFDRDYDGNAILTDEKMKMFAWWFESKSAEFPEIKSYSLSSKSLKIPLFSVAKIEDLLKMPDISEAKKKIFENAESESAIAKNISFSFEKILKELKNSLSQVREISEKGLKIAENAIAESKKNETENSDLPFQSQIAEIEEIKKIDLKIARSKCKEIISLYFPETRISEENSYQARNLFVFTRARISYSQIIENVKKIQKYLSAL